MLGVTAFGASESRQLCTTAHPGCHHHSFIIYTPIKARLDSLAISVAATAYFVLSPGYATAEYRRIRTFLFIGLGLSGIVPVAHKMLQHGVILPRMML